jgi:exopolysaccharide biosynthesis polyprenyl glycosylphosphotransferase
MRGASRVIVSARFFPNLRRSEPFSDYDAVMTPNRRRFMKYLAKLFDLGALAASIVVALMAFSSPTGITLAGFMAMQIKLANCLGFALLLAMWHNLFIFCGLYLSKRLTTPLAQMFEVCKAATLAAAFLFLSAKAFHLGIVRPNFVLVFWLSSTLLMGAGRVLARSLLLILRRRGRNARYILIVGTNLRAIEFARQVGAHRELGYRIVGFVDDDWAGIPVFESTGHRRCCSFAGLADFLRLNVIDEAAIFLPLRSYYAHAAELVSLCGQHGIVTRFDSQVFQLRTPHAQVQDLEENSQVLAGTGSAAVIPAMIKRLLDCLFSSLLLLILAPLFLVVAVLIWLTSPGPVFFRQTRVGLNKRQFRIYKFRTMVANAEQLQEQLLARNEMSGPVFKIKKDPRVTPLGRFLRKTSIDELPQLLNVLQGEMSLVGPRAMSLRDYRLFDQDWQRRRFSVKPGITCLWQIHGRNSVPFEKWMELDMQYIDKWSLWLDLKILARTLPAVLRGTGAA